MDIDQLRTFLAVLEHGGFSRAADALHLGQSTVSFHIKALETAVGTRLLDRLGGKVRPTATGKQLRRYAVRIVSLREEALARLRAEELGQAGRVAIASSTIPAEYLLPRALAEFRRRHPAVAVSVEVSDSRRAAASLMAQECDFALVGARVRDKRTVCTPFAEDEIVLVGRSPARPASARSSARAQLERVPIVVREEGSGTHGAVAGLIARHGASQGDGPAPIRVGSTQLARRCILDGVGLAFMSRYAVEEDLAAGRLQVVAFPGTPVRRRFWVARLKSVTLPAAAKELVRILTK